MASEVDTAADHDLQASDRAASASQRLGEPAGLAELDVDGVKAGEAGQVGGDVQARRRRRGRDGASLPAPVPAGGERR